MPRVLKPRRRKARTPSPRHPSDGNELTRPHLTAGKLANESPRAAGAAQTLADDQQ